MPEVDYKIENIQKCQCPTCPVQQDSSCAKKQMTELQEALQSKEGGMPDPRIVPGLFCSTGKAPCTDLDFSKTCLCPVCEVWKDYDLVSIYYCRKGSAGEVG